MSAWTVSKKHIDLLVTLAAKAELLGKHTETQLGQILWDENYRSVNFRYNENNPAPRYEFSPFDLSNLSTVAQIKQIRCYQYQTCETEDYDTTPSFVLTEKLCKLLEKGVRISKGKEIYDAPQWDSAPWGV